MENYNRNNKEKDDGKKIILLIILAIVLLLLITSCSCTSQFFGKLGSSLSDSINNVFKKEEDIPIDKDTNDRETITNQELKFDTDSLEIALDAEDGRLSFSYSKITPNGFTCSTSNADIAYCYVSGGHVVIVPKKVGSVTVTLQTTTNGKTYEASATVTITDSKKYIDLSSNSGTINLRQNNQKTVSYSLIGMEGDVTVTSSDESVATAIASQGKLLITGHKKGTAKITLSITYNGKRYTNTYTVTVIDQEVNQSNNNKPGGNKPNTNPSQPGQDKPSENNKNRNNYLKSLEVLNSNYNLDQSFNQKINNYSIRVSYNEKDLSLKAEVEVATSSIQYKLNGISIIDLNNLHLIEGNNYLEIIVISESGEVNTYTVSIYNPKRTIRFEYSAYTTYLSIPSIINYVVEEEGNVTEEYNLASIKANLDAYGKECEIEVHKGYIVLTPRKTNSGTQANLSIIYDGKQAQTKILFDKYVVSSLKDKYDMSYVNGAGERDIVLNTNLFAGKSTHVVNSNHSKEVSICNDDNSYCVTLTVDSANDTGDITLEYVGDHTEPNALPFKIQAGSIGNSKIHVVGKVQGILISEFDIEIAIGNKYHVIISANGGLFNEFTDTYEFFLSYDESIDLSKYDEPYKIGKVDGTCVYYKFKGYSTSIDGPIIYNRTDKSIIKELQDHLELYAIYETSSSPIVDNPIKKTLWLTEVDLFHNEEYFKQYGEDKVIYPGAAGSYKMNFTNESDDVITITGMTLKEKNICIPNKGCLNMGYMIRYSAFEDDNYTYYYGEPGEKYWILNRKDDTIKETGDRFTAMIPFKEDEKIELAPNETAVITVFWKWQEIDDELDTLIGNHAAEKLTDASINDKYGLSIGLDFETEIKTCQE